MTHSFYSITSNEKTSYYQTEDFGSLMELLALLREVHTVKDRVPSIRTGNAERLVLYSKNLIPFCPGPHMRLFQPLEPEKYTELLRQFPEQDTDDRQVILDYDGNHFSFSEWGDEGPTTISGSLDGVVSAYSGALRKKNSRQTYINEKVLIAEMERICEVTPFESVQGQGQIQGMNLDMQL